MQWTMWNSTENILKRISKKYIECLLMVSNDQLKNSDIVKAMHYLKTSIGLAKNSKHE